MNCIFNGQKLFSKQKSNDVALCYVCADFNARDIVIVVICIATFFATLAGGLFALKFKSKLYLILGFSAGVVISTAFFDLLPAAMDLSAKVYSTRIITTVFAFGFIAYLSVDRSLSSLTNALNLNNGAANWRGRITVLFFTLHSFLDGVSIGLAFQVSNLIGGIVSAAVLVHDFADGINTANIILKEQGNRKSVITWIIVNASAPLVGAWFTFYFHLPKENLGILLAFIAGAFLYIGASDFLPESYQRNPRIKTLLMTLLGFTIIFLAIQIAGNL